MDRAKQIEAVRTLLARAGFAVSERCDLRPVSFDLVARRDKDLVLLKILYNVDALSEEIASEIKTLSRFLDARPVVVGERAGTGPLEEGVVYARHAIPIVTPQTLEAFLLQGTAPLVFAAPGGLYVNLDFQRLREMRQEAAMSLGSLAQVAGVTRRAIQMYEEGMNAGIDAAVRLEEYFGVELIRPVDPFSVFRFADYEPEPMAPGGREDPLERVVRTLLEGVGYSVRQTRRSPFQALSSQAEDTFLTGIGRESPQLARRAKMVASVSRIMERPGFFIVERTTRRELEGTPVITRRELRKISDPEAILELILERQPRAKNDVEAA